jgi:LmbE family N-acetylglucosaminyl deacetylase
VVVAHPDDEVLWGAGLMLRYPHREWTVICCSIPRLDLVRAYKFFASCERLGARGRLLPFCESAIMAGLKYLDLAGFDCIVTHNAAGEYGHAQHRLIHKYVVKKNAQPIITFGANRTGRGAFVLRLTKEELIRKMAALRCYDHFITWRGEKTRRWKTILDARKASGYRAHIESYDLFTR